jgi:hypothetical protein
MNFTDTNTIERALPAIFNAQRLPNYALEEFRKTQGLSLSIESYYPLFGEINSENQFSGKDRIENLFSCYGWANINTIDKISLKYLVKALTGSDYTAEKIYEIIQTLRLQGKIIAPGDLPSIFGPVYNIVFPYINTEALMNVNFTDPLILKELITNPVYIVPSAEKRLETLLTQRISQGIKSKDIQTILGIDDTNPLLQYFGAVTWFWKIIIEGENHKMEVLISRLPSVETESSLKLPVYTIIERRSY